MWNKEKGRGKGGGGIDTYITYKSTTPQSEGKGGKRGNR